MHVFEEMLEKKKKRLTNTSEGGRCPEALRVADDLSGSVFQVISVAGVGHGAAHSALSASRGGIRDAWWIATVC